MRHAFKAALLVSSALIATPALAQNVLNAPPPTEYVVDDRGVDLIAGTFNLASADVVIGQSGQGGLTYERTFAGAGWRDNVTGTLQSTSSSNYVASFGGYSEAFTLSGTTFTPVVPNGSTLVKSGSTYIWTLRDGMQLIFNQELAGGAYTSSGIYSRTAANQGRIVEMKAPNGEIRTFHYEVVEAPEQVVFPIMPSQSVRLGSVTNNFGYQIHIKYAFALPPESWEQLELWLMPTKVTGLNNAVDHCFPLNQGCTFSRTWPSAAYAATSTSGTVTDQSGRATTYSYAGGLITGIKRPGSATNDVAINYTAGRVASVQAGSEAWGYAYAASGDTRTTTITDPASQTWQATGSIAGHTLLSWRNPLLQTTSYAYDAGRLSQTTLPGGQTTDYVYDGRGNVTRTTTAPASGSGLSPIVTSASYPATCANVMTCNKPTATTDARGGVTNYTYDATHGGVLTITEPAPEAGAVRPQTRVTYGTRNAWYKNGSGVITQDPAGVSLPTAVSTCQSTASCAGTDDEVITAISYGSTGVANNLLPTLTTTRNGAGTLSASTTLTYTANGDVASVDGPLPGSDDATTYRYDAARQLVGAIGPDPDGSGPLLRRAQRLTYNPRGQATLAEVGTVSGLTDANWAAFNSLQQAEATYDVYGRLTHQRSQSGGVTHSLTQTSYDTAGRTDCTVIRMNPATFASPPISACTATALGTFGPDRITKNGYDAASRLTSTISGFGVDPIIESVTYNANGQPLTLTDGKSNVSTIEYDGFGRAAKMFYPNAYGGGSSSTDYEQYTYDAASNVTAFRNRGGELISSRYDALNRRVTMGGLTIADISLTYDNLGRPLTVRGNNILLDFGWDALGRRVRETNPIGTVWSSYDLAGRRTGLSWPDGFYVNYDYNIAGDMTAIRENGATSWSLGAWDHDNLGRRVAMARANGVSTAWTYDAAGRLGVLSHDLPGATDDQSLTFAYNPAGQIVSRSLSNPAYAYAPGSGTTSYVNNGRNQVTSVGGSAVTYDARQNVAAAPMGSYVYDGLGQMKSATVGGATTAFSYDPVGRMFQMGATRLLHDGARPMAEYNAAGAVLRRYVPGLAMDETVAAYEGAGLTDRRWLLADERLSVAAYTNGSGGVLARNTYDEYGQPGVGNAGLFQYTGQVWLPQAQVYHYKARIYAPSMGRFMQTDPIGYGDGANVYAYVGGDPVNVIDPLGLERREYACGNIGVGSRPHPDGSTEYLYKPTYCSIDLGVGSWFEQQGGRAIGRIGRDDTRMPQCIARPGLAYDLLGKANASGLSVAGLAFASAAWIAGKTQGTNPQWSTGNNAIQLVGSPINIDNRAINLGNVQIYSPQGPSSSIESYSHRQVNLGMHEEAHTYQAQSLGSFGYIAAHLALGVGRPNLLEMNADEYALATFCS